MIILLLACAGGFLFSGCEKDGDDSSGPTRNEASPAVRPSVEGDDADAPDSPAVDDPFDADNSSSKPKVDKALYVAFGDSLTLGTRGDNYPEILARLIGKAVVNEGREGDTSGNGLARLHGVLAAYRPGGLIILYGANDAIINLAADETLHNLSGMIDMAKSENTTPVIATLTPMFAEHEVYQERVSILNEGIRRLAFRKHVLLVDLEWTVTAAQMLPDGLHCNDDGMRAVARAFASVLVSVP